MSHVWETSGPSGSALFQQRDKIVLASKALSHLALGTRPHTKRSVRLLAGASLAADVLSYGTRVPSRPTGAVSRSLADTVEAAVWSVVGDQTVGAVRPVTIATTVPAAIELGFRTMLPSRVSRATRVASAVGLLGAPLAVGAGIRQRVHGKALPGQVGWAAMAYAAGAALGWIRGRAHENARREWRSRFESDLQAERTAAYARTTLVQSPAHHFRSTLVALREAGSDQAAQAIADIDRRKAKIVASGEGNTLMSIANSFDIPVEPGRYFHLWLTNRQLDEVRRFIDQADSAPIDPQQDTLKVSMTSPSERRKVHTLLETDLTVRYLGHQGKIETEKSFRQGQRLGILLDGAPAGLAGAAVWKLGTSHPLPAGSLPFRVVAPSVAFDLLGILVHWKFMDDRQHDAVTVLHSMVVATGFAMVVPYTQDRLFMDDGSPIHPSTLGALGCAVVLGNYWGRLGSWRYAALGWLLLLPVIGSHPDMREVHHLIWELCFVAMAFLGTLGFQDVADAEAARVVDDELQANINRMIQTVRDLRLSELEIFDDQVAMAKREIDRLSAELGEEAPLLLEQANSVGAWVRHERRRTRGRAR